MQQVTIGILTNPLRPRIRRADGTSHESNPLSGTFSFTSTYRSPRSPDEVSLTNASPKPGLVYTGR